MPRKYVLSIAGLLVVLLATGFLTALALSDAAVITKAKFDKIQNGMTLKDVETIFDGQAGQRVESTRENRLPEIPEGKCVFWWLEKDVSVAIVVFEDDRVVRKEWGQNDETVMQRIGRWLRLR